MIIINATPLAVSISMDTLQAKAVMHALRYVLDDPQAEVEHYVSKRMAETGQPMPVKDAMILLGQVAVTMARLLSSDEVTAIVKADADTLQLEEHDEDCPQHPDNKTPEVATKGKTKDGDWKN